MCKYNTLKINNDINGIIASMDEMDACRPLTHGDDRCYRGMDTYLGSVGLREQWDECKLAAARAVGQPEHVLYEEDTSPYTTNKLDDDIIAQVVELQTRMSNGLYMINDIAGVRDGYMSIYLDAKETFSKGKALLSEWESKGKGNTVYNWVHKDLFFQRLNERNDAWDHFDGYKSSMSDHVQVLWDHWNKLKDECMGIIGDNKAIWVTYFQMDDKEDWLYRYLNDLPQDKGTEHLMSNPDLDSRMLVNDEAYSMAHKEENEELFVYNM